MREDNIYTVTHKYEKDKCFIIAYGFDGNLSSLRFAPSCPADFKEDFFTYLPFTEKSLIPIFRDVFEIEKTQGYSMKFDYFWDLYGYKVGNKKRAEKLYKELTGPEKMQALSHIRKYKKFTNKKRIDLCYPETYLSQRRWENILPTH